MVPTPYSLNNLLHLKMWFLTLLWPPPPSHPAITASTSVYRLLSLDPCDQYAIAFCVHSLSHNPHHETLQVSRRRRTCITLNLPQGHRGPTEFSNRPSHHDSYTAMFYQSAPDWVYRLNQSPPTHPQPESKLPFASDYSTKSLLTIPNLCKHAQTIVSLFARFSRKSQTPPHPRSLTV